MKNKKGSGQLWGMVLYDIMGDGCLRGSWTNIFTGQKKIMNEIARKKGESGRQELPGEYYVSWIEDRGGPLAGTLRIEPKGNHFALEWIVSGKIVYRGLGMLLGEKQLTATYWDGDVLSLGHLPRVAAATELSEGIAGKDAQAATIPVKDPAILPAIKKENPGSATPGELPAGK